MDKSLLIPVLYVCLKQQMHIPRIITAVGYVRQAVYSLSITIALIEAPDIPTYCIIACFAGHYFSNLALLNHLWLIATIDISAESVTHTLAFIFCSHPSNKKKHLHIFDNDKLWTIEESKDLVTLLENHILEKYLHDTEDLTRNTESSKWTITRLASNLISLSFPATLKVITGLVFSHRTVETVISPKANQMRKGSKWT